MSAGTGFGAVRLGGEQGVMSMNVGDMCQWMGNGLRGGRVARKVCEPPSIIVSQGAWGHAYGGLDKRGWGWDQYGVFGSTSRCLVVAVYGGDNKSSNSAWVAEILSGCDPPAWTVDSAVIYQLREF